ncbi:MAG: hypothetical protein JNK11_16915 [Alphaproteobacteria bacterium]|nr:hypothetical protein [Alphaproteobacteria bacterium]
MTHPVMPGVIKRGSVSLIGGIVVGIFVLLLARLVLGEAGVPGTTAWIAAAATGLVVGAYVRLADL